MSHNGVVLLQHSVFALTLLTVSNAN